MKPSTEIFTKQEIEGAFHSMIEGKLKNRKSSLMLDLIGQPISAANNSLLPVGVDGVTTCHVLRSEASKQYFFDEIYRLVNEYEPDSTIPRLMVKKYKVLEIETEPEKKRKIVIPCLRDQVIVRCILNRLNAIGITGEFDKPNPKIGDVTKRIMDTIASNSTQKIIRTDISNFYPSINTERLCQKLQASHGEKIGEPIMHLIRKIILDNKSRELYTGLPVGIGFCVLLANYYISQMNLKEHFPEAEVVRYEDDLLFIINQQEDEEKIKSNLDTLLKEFGLQRSDKKTETIAAMAEFKFVGINFKNGKPFISDERVEKWKQDVQKDIRKQFKELNLLKTLDPQVKTPANKTIVDQIWREHKKGIRSKFYKHRLRINSLGTTNH